MDLVTSFTHEYHVKPRTVISAQGWPCEVRGMYVLVTIEATGRYCVHRAERRVSHSAMWVPAHVSETHDALRAECVQLHRHCTQYAL